MINQDTVTIASKYLERPVKIKILLPPHFTKAVKYPLLLLNDGQELDQLKAMETLQKLYDSAAITTPIVVGIYADKHRLDEYGTAHKADYLGRGSKAKNFTTFVMNELLPFLENQYSLSSRISDRVYAGFSLGGLSAMDIVWNNSSIFGKVGVFSGSFWWRSRAYNDHYQNETDRIMHQQIKNTESSLMLHFWLEAGTADEKNDRNNNGVIDSIEDTADIISELLKKGYPERNIQYIEVADGEHNFNTWSAVFSDFMRWAFGKSNRIHRVEK